MVFMNKKFFALLTGLLISAGFDVFAAVVNIEGFQVTDGVFDARKVYLLKTTIGLDSAVYITENKEGNGVVARGFNDSFENYFDTQQSLWAIRCDSGHYVFANMASGHFLSFDNDGFTLGGNSKWTLSADSVLSVKGVPLNFSDDMRNPAYGRFGLFADSVNAAVTKIAVHQAKGSIALTPRELNSFYNKKKPVSCDSELRFAFDQKNTIPSPFTLSLQAVSASIINNGMIFPESISDVSKDGEGWVVLNARGNSRFASGYLVVDTAYFGKPLLQITTDTLNAEGRLADSYLFKIFYDLERGFLDITSKGYIKEPDSNGLWWSVAPKKLAEPAEKHLACYSDVTGSLSYAFNAVNPLEILPADLLHVRRTIPAGAYTLKVIGSADRTRIGKYAAAEMFGDAIDYIAIDATSQNVKRLPAFHWFFEYDMAAGIFQSTIINREFETLMLAVNATMYQTSVDNRFFLAERDTFEFAEITDASLSLGYFMAGESGIDYTIQYHYDQTTDVPLFIASEDKNMLRINTGSEEATVFRLIPDKTETFGYENKLIRMVYVIGVLNADGNRQSFLGLNSVDLYCAVPDMEQAASFILREQFEITSSDGVVSRYYALLDARAFASGNLSGLTFNPIDLSFSNRKDFVSFFKIKDNRSNVSNNGVKATGEASVFGGSGRITVTGASGKKVVVSNVLGRVITNRLLSSDEAVIAVPTGIAVVSVEGGTVVKVLVK
ncbi:hypothetical protein Barb7_00197 [Bacteroidales bacterium Barb7]|nr:hypothetical protein Barb7_00197 [Bacteroidales bacterium Barb7]